MILKRMPLKMQRVSCVFYFTSLKIFSFICCSCAAIIEQPNTNVTVRSCVFLFHRGPPSKLKFKVKTDGAEARLTRSKGRTTHTYTNVSRSARQRKSPFHVHAHANAHIQIYPMYPKYNTCQHLHKLADKHAHAYTNVCIHIYPMYPI